MVTITISEDVCLSKTHFDTVLEAMHVLSWAKISSSSNDIDRIAETSANKKAYEDSIAWVQETYSLSDAKTEVLWG